MQLQAALCRASLAPATALETESSLRSMQQDGGNAYDGGDDDDDDGYSMFSPTPEPKQPF